MDGPLNKRLKSSSEAKGHKESRHDNSAINPQDPNLRIPLSNVDSNNNHVMDMSNNGNIEENKRKY
ncbi:17774_t:CDS:1, partial [Racocetra fulgida]